ncbi:2Fe-2S iron-sulfur cluster-binding protein [Pigmentiphaga sp.]|uniref:2Fe-2S iron-sulfur cluster-binding protein n=1 Tax=Pigmentiphaga sp. TaxID=1977564 RepID=UPI0012C8BD04|nr:2Fe-2S iron-sulfur cluster-binding protein [Pigmentiphaga sp.]MPS27984.1 2Fe-2S iron-sulfur cluster binding domain-containing protein [Alcaligenaceae bacterium SAGV5]MPS51050.1 2Fe-2S iron-sulfur cluster binding domain-containing protein [Alcaligenaceae bacterium SAGV3]MPT59388.1 2Fe-2S iron-sulfur cluster binding domain-containing protein [Alcaligenaceae bacterium]
MDTPASGPRHTVTLDPQQWTFAAGEDESLFLAARRAGVRLPAICRNGTCRTCFSRMESGSVRYLVDWPGLSAQEKQEGFILPCVAVATSAIVMVNPHAEKTGGGAG